MATAEGDTIRNFTISALEPGAGGQAMKPQVMPRQTKLLHDKQIPLKSIHQDLNKGQMPNATRSDERNNIARLPVVETETKRERDHHLNKQSV